MSNAQGFKPFALLEAPKPKKVQRARLFLKPLGEPMVTATLDGPASIGRTCILSDRGSFESLWKERLAVWEITVHVMPSIDGFTSYVLGMHDRATLRVDVSGADNAVSRTHIILLPPGDGQDNWRVVDSISCNGTRLNNKTLQPGRIYALRNNDNLIIASETGREEPLLTARFVDLLEDEDKYHALIVSNPQGDDASRTARALRFKDELEKRHFSVSILSDGITREDIEKELGKKAGCCYSDTIFLFAYTGHISEHGELCMRDAPYPKERFFEIIHNFRSKNIIAIDGCFSYCFAEGNIPARTTVVTSTDMHQTSARGILTEAFIQCFKDTDVSITIDKDFRQRLIEKGYFIHERQNPDIHEGRSRIQVRSRMTRG